MGEGFTAGRIVTALLLVAILVLQWNVMQSLDHLQAQVTALNNDLERMSKSDHGGSASASNSGSSSSGNAVDVKQADRRKILPDGKDAIGRPAQARPGYTIYPPLDREYPGRTIARTAEKIPALTGTYRQGEPSEPGIINYLLCNEGTTGIIDRDVHERLFNINPDDPLELWPELAVAWESAPDKLTYIFHLRRGVVFSDGSPFGSDDVMFTFDAIFDPATECGHKRGYFPGVESVRALDPLTVEVRVRTIYWKALNNFGFNLRIHSREYFEREIPKKARELGITQFSVTPGEPGFAKVFNEFKRTITAGTGPYMWREGESWVTNQHITLYSNMSAWLRALNPDHYRLERMRWRIVRDQVAREEEFKKGNIDALSLDHNTWADHFSKDPEITRIAEHKVYDHIGLLFSYIAFNCRRAPFDDVEVRRAVALLMDRERLLKDVERGNGAIATCPSKPIYPEYSHDIVPRKFDPDSARAILTKAGWKDSDGDGFFDKDGRMLQFTFSYPSSRIFFKTVATLMKEACDKAGIRCNLEPKEWSLFVQDAESRNFDMSCLYASAIDPWTDPFDTFHSSQAGSNQGNVSGYNNPEADKLMEAMRVEFDADKRNGMFHELNKILDRDVPLLLLLHGQVGLILNKRMQGAKIRPTGLRPFDLWIDPKDLKDGE